MKYVKLNSRVLKAVWDESKGIYDVEVSVNGEVVHDWCHILVNGTGFLNDWKCKTLPTTISPYTDQV